MLCVMLLCYVAMLCHVLEGWWELEGGILVKNSLSTQFVKEPYHAICKHVPTHSF